MKGLHPILGARGGCACRASIVGACSSVSEPVYGRWRPGACFSTMMPMVLSRIARRTESDEYR